jgi:hypothetical protein
VAHSQNERREGLFCVAEVVIGPGGRDLVGSVKPSETGDVGSPLPIPKGKLGSGVTIQLRDKHFGPL